MAMDVTFTVAAKTKTVVCFDRRASAVLHTFHLPDYGTAISYDEGHLWVGDAKGHLNLLDPDLTSLMQYDLGHNRRVTDVKHNAGCVISASYDKGANTRITTSGLRPRLLANLSPVDQQPTKLDYRNGILASGFVDGSVRVWIPVDRK